MQLKRVLLFVKDLPRMKAFYGEALGMKILPGETESWVEFDAGGASVGLHAVPKEIAAGLEVANPPMPREDTPYKLMFEVEDAELERQRFEATGVTIIHRPWGSYDILDPEGNIVGIYSSQPTPGRD